MYIFIFDRFDFFFAYLFLLLENLALGWLALLGLDAVEELVVQVLWHLHLADVNFGRRGDHVDLVDASERATVELEWTGDEQKTRFQLLKEYNSLFCFKIKINSLKNLKKN